MPDVPPPLYRVRDWSNRHFSSEAKKLRKLVWIKLPCDRESPETLFLISRPNHERVLAAWFMILDVASKSPVRGELRDQRRPFTAQDMQILTGVSAVAFEEAFDVLTQPDIAWIECVPWTGEVINSPEPSKRRGRPSKTEITVEILNSIDRMIEWQEAVASQRKPQLDANEDTTKKLIAAAKQALAEGQVPVSLFKNIVFEEHFRTVKDTFMDAAREALAAHKRRGRASTGPESMGDLVAGLSSRLTVGNNGHNGHAN